MIETNVLVIGGGPAGTVAALRARELGATAALIERGSLGGTCTNDGCVPTRALAKAARLIRDTEQFADYGITAFTPQLDFARVLAKTRQVVDDVHAKKQLAENLREAGVVLFEQAGAARFIDPHTVELHDGSRVRGDTIIICAGGQARRLPFPGAELALTHSDIWEVKQLPRSVAIVGAAATGCQLASIFDAFGVEVALLDVAPRLLPTTDESIARIVGKAFAQRGMRLINGIGGIDQIIRLDDNMLQLHYQHTGEQESLTVEAVMLSVGWPGNLEQLNLAAAGVTTERGYITVDTAHRTVVPHIYAAGDITGRLMLVQGAAHQGRLAVENALLGSNRVFDGRVVPYGGFTDPEYGSVGLTEDEARNQYECIVTEVPYADIDRAVIDGRTLGMFKLIVDRDTRQILGAHVVGEQALEVVQIVAAAMSAGTQVERLAELKLAYPTFTAIVGVAARQVVRELGVVPMAPYWRDLRRVRIAEWERSKAQQSRHNEKPE